MNEGKKSDSRSQGGVSTSSKNSAISKIQENKLLAANYDPTKIKLLQDKLSDKERERLANLLKEIDDNIDDLKREKEEYFKQQLFTKVGKGFDTSSHLSRATGGSKTTTSNNAYLYS